MPQHSPGIKSSTEFSKVKKRKRKKKSPDRAKLPVDVSDVVFKGVPNDLAAKMRDRLAEAAEAFDAERFADAEKLLESIETLAPGAAEVAELRGLANYRLGKYKKALTWLDQFAGLTGSVEQHPVIADCCRALKRWSAAEDKWLDVKEISPGPEILEESRIVQAGVLSDQGKLVEAISFLEASPKSKGKPSIFIIRRLYVLAGLYEQAGNVQKAKSTYQAILGAEPQFGDVAERLADLS